MTDKLDTKKYLEGLTLSDEERTVMERVLSNEKNYETANRWFLRRDEGSRIADEAKRTKEDAERIQLAAEEKDKGVDAYRQELESWEVLNKKQLEWADSYRKQLQTQGIDPDSVVGKALTKEHNADVPVPPFDTKELDTKYLSVDVGRTLGRIALNLPFEIQAVQNEYVRLYGSLDGFDVEKLREAATANLMKDIPVKTTAAEMFKFAEKQAENTETDIQARIQKGIDDGLAKAATTQGFPAPVLGQTPSHTFNESFSTNVSRSVPESGTDSASAEEFARANQELAQQGVTLSW